MSAQTTTVRISGKRGKVTVAVTDGATAEADFCRSAAKRGFGPLQHDAVEAGDTL